MVELNFKDIRINIEQWSVRKNVVTISIEDKREGRYRVVIHMFEHELRDFIEACLKLLKQMYGLEKRGG